MCLYSVITRWCHVSIHNQYLFPCTQLQKHASKYKEHKNPYFLLVNIKITFQLNEWAFAIPSNKDGYSVSRAAVPKVRCVDPSSFPPEKVNRFKERSGSMFTVTLWCHGSFFGSNKYSQVSELVNSPTYTCGMLINFEKLCGCFPLTSH